MLLRWLSRKNPPARQQMREFNPQIRKMPWRRKRQPIPVFWPGESHRQRSLAGYSPWDSKSQTQFSDYTNTIGKYR